MNPAHLTGWPWRLKSGEAIEGHLLSLRPGHRESSCREHRTAHMQMNAFKLPGRYPEEELLSHTLTPFLTFWETSILFSIVAVPVYTPTSSEQRSLFLHSLSTDWIKQDVVHVDRGTLLSHKKSWNTAIGHNRDGSWKYVRSEISQKEKVKDHMISLICGI